MHGSRVILCPVQIVLKDWFVRYGSVECLKKFDKKCNAFRSEEKIGRRWAPIENKLLEVGNCGNFQVPIVQNMVN